MGILDGISSILFGGGSDSAGQGSGGGGLFDFSLKDVLGPAALVYTTQAGIKGEQKLAEQARQDRLALEQQQLAIQREKLANELKQIEAGMAAKAAELKQLAYKTSIEATLQGGKNYADTILGAGTLQQNALRR